MQQPESGGPGAPKETQTQRQRVYQTILNAAWQGGPGVEVFVQSGLHQRHFIKVSDGNSYFIFYTRLEPGHAGFEVSKEGEPEYTFVRELTRPTSVDEDARLTRESRALVPDKKVNDALLTIALTRARDEDVKQIPLPEVVRILKGASVLPER